MDSLLLMVVGLGIHGPVHETLYSCLEISKNPQSASNTTTSQYCASNNDKALQAVTGA